MIILLLPSLLGVLHGLQREWEPIWRTGKATADGHTERRLGSVVARRRVARRPGSVAASLGLERTVYL
jgi:hypothetical protein